MKMVYVVFSLIILIFILIISFLLTKSLGAQGVTLDLPINSNDNYIIYGLGFNDIVDLYQTNGVVKGDDYYRVVTYDVNLVSFSIVIDKNSDFLKDDVLLVVDDIDILAPCDGRIITVLNSAETIEIAYIDYDALYIDASIGESDYNIIDYDSNVIIKKDNEEINCSISYIGYELIGGKIPIKIEGDFSIIPGANVEVEITRFVYEDCTSVFTDWLSVNLQGDYFLKRIVESGGVKTFIDTPVDVLFFGDVYSSISIDEEFLADEYAKFID